MTKSKIFKPLVMVVLALAMFWHIPGAAPVVFAKAKTVKEVKPKATSTTTKNTKTKTKKTTKKGYEGKALSKTCYVRVIDESSTGGGITYGYNETPLYVCLYSDGEMVISSKAIKPEDGRKVIGNKK